MEIAPAPPTPTNPATPTDRGSGRADDPLLALFAGLLVQAAARGGAPPYGAPAQTLGTDAMPQQAPPARARSLGPACERPSTAAGPDTATAWPDFDREGQPLPAPLPAGAERPTTSLAPGAPDEARGAPPASGSGTGVPTRPETLLAAAARIGVSSEARAGKNGAVEPPTGADAHSSRESKPSTADQGKLRQPQASSIPDDAARSDSTAAGDAVGALSDAQTVPDQQPGPPPGEANALYRAEIAAAGGSRHETPAASAPGTAFAAVTTPEHPSVVAFAAPDPQGRPVTARLTVADGGNGRRLRIELSPAELGRVEVFLRLDGEGNAAALFTVDRPETLQLLQRDARAVAELLATAGFSIDQGGLGFLLRDGAGDMGRPGRQPQAGPGPRSRPGLGAAEGDLPLPPAIAWSSRGLLDLRV